MRTRRSFGATALGVVALALGACAPSAPSTSGSSAAGGATVQLQAWGWNQDPGWKKAVESFNASHHTIQVSYRGVKADEYNNVLQTGLSGSDGPDVVMLRSYGGLETVAAAGLISELGDSIPELGDFPDAVLQGARSVKDQKLYGVPFAIQTANVQYNKTLFAKYHVDVPTTWQEFLSACATFQKNGIVPMSTTFKDSWMLPILRDMFGASAYGGPQFATDLLNGSAKFTDPRYASANSVLLDLKKYFPKDAAGLSYDDSKTLFISGKAAMFPGGIWELAPFRTAAPDLDIGLFNPPRVGGSGAPYAMGYVDGSWGMSAKTPKANREAAETFLRWTASKEYGSRMADDLLQLSTVPGVEPKDPVVAQAASMFADNPTPYLTYVNFDYGTPTGTELEYGSLQKMVLGKEAAAQVGRDLDRGISQWFRPRTS